MYRTECHWLGQDGAIFQTFNLRRCVVSREKDDWYRFFHQSQSDLFAGAAPNVEIQYRQVWKSVADMVERLLRRGYRSNDPPPGFGKAEFHVHRNDGVILHQEYFPSLTHD